MNLLCAILIAIQHVSSLIFASPAAPLICLASRLSRDTHGKIQNYFLSLLPKFKNHKIYFFQSFALLLPSHPASNLTTSPHHHPSSSLLSSLQPAPPPLVKSNNKQLSTMFKRSPPPPTTTYSRAITLFLIALLFCVITVRLLSPTPSIITHQQQQENNNEQQPQPESEDDDTSSDSQHPFIPDEITTTTPTNILFTKIPKVGGTTVAVILQRYAQQFNLTIAKPDPKQGQISTCGSVSSSMRAWNDLKRRTGSTFDIVATHGCFQNFMKNDASAWKSPKNLIAVTMLRDPWARFYSYFRFVQRCCMLDPPLEWCRRDCNWASSVDKFVTRHCSRDSPDCNQMSYYLMPGISKLPTTLSGAEALVVLKPFDLVLTSSHFNEGLVLLHLVYHIPFITLIQIDANKNNDAPLEQPSEDLKKRAMQVMQPDAMLYNTANKILALQISKVDPFKFHSILEKLIQARKLVKEKCSDYFGKCIRNDVDMIYGASCFHQCTEAVVKGIDIPKIPQCDVDLVNDYCTSGVFLKGCWKCTCVVDNDGNNVGSAKCEQVSPILCRSIDKDAVCG